jgi:hypothetical protein
MPDQRISAGNVGASCQGLIVAALRSVGVGCKRSGAKILKRHRIAGIVQAQLAGRCSLDHGAAECASRRPAAEYHHDTLIGHDRVSWERVPRLRRIAQGEPGNIDGRACIIEQLYEFIVGGVDYPVAVCVALSCIRISVNLIDDPAGV